MSVYYNDNDSYCCRVLRARIADGSLPKGFVDERDISEIDPTEIGEFNQWHLFAGIGGFPLGLVWAGLPPDTRILTGGFPCQDISTAGKGAGLSGKRLSSSSLKC
jgi:DNA (cytosine-5)-methyltransferase 1